MTRPVDLPRADITRLLALLAEIDEWLSNDEMLLNEDVIAWRDQLAQALGLPELG